MGCFASKGPKEGLSSGAKVEGQATFQSSSGQEPRIGPKTEAAESQRKAGATAARTGVHSAKVEFCKFSLDELKLATKSFSEENVISEGGRQAVNIVFKGTLVNGELVAVKKLPRKEWQTEEQFAAEAENVGRVRSNGVVRLLGYCSEEHAFLLVAEFMPNSTLSQHLFHYDRQPMIWSQRINVAVKVARALNDLIAEGTLVYHDLNPYRVLFDTNFQPQLSCFGLIRAPGEGDSSSNLENIPPEFLRSGSRKVTAESMVYSFGALLLALLSGKSIRPTQFLELVQEKSTMNVVVDSALMERPGSDSAMELIPLVAKCLQLDPQRRPPMKTVLKALEVIESGSNGKPAEQSGQPTQSPEEEELRMGPFGKAAAAGDFKVLHNMLVKEMYGTPPQEPSFEMWNPEMQEMLNARKKGDIAFKGKQWEEAIMYYALYRKLDTAKLPLMFARRSLCHLQLQQWEAALNDAMTAHFEGEDWPHAYYLQAAALKKLGLEEDFQEMLATGARKEIEKQSSPSEKSRPTSPAPLWR